MPRFAFAIVFALLSIAGCGNDPTWVKVTSQEYGEDWPFPGYQSGLLDCKISDWGRPLAIIKLGQVWYGLNGAAFGQGGYPDSRTLWGKHPEWGTPMSGATVQLIKRANKICAL